MAYSYNLALSKINYNATSDKIMAIEFTTNTGLDTSKFKVNSVEIDGEETAIPNTLVTESSGTYTAALNSPTGVSPVGIDITIQYIDGLNFSNKLFIDTKGSFDALGASTFEMELPETDPDGERTSFKLTNVGDQEFSLQETEAITIKSRSSQPYDDNSSIQFTDYFKPYLTHFAGEVIQLNVLLKDSGNSPVSGDYEIGIEAGLKNITIKFDPADGTINVPIDKIIYIKFSRAITKTNGDELTNSDIDTSIIVLEDSSSNDVPYTGSISSDKKTITITPDSNLSNNEVYTITLLGDTVKDSEDGNISQQTVPFTTAI